MIVIADTSPINYLILIQEIAVLHTLYGNVVLPQAVRDELLHPSADPAVRAWMARPPSWIEVRSPAKELAEFTITLDPGEREAIALANELRADCLVIDDRAGRIEAAKRGIAVIGTLGVLRTAAMSGLVDLRSVVDRLGATNFYVAPEVLERLLKPAPKMP